MPGGEKKDFIQIILISHLSQATDSLLKCVEVINRCGGSW